MGLDIVAYEKAVLTEPHEYTDECYDDDGHVLAFVIDPSMDRSLRGLVAGRHYTVSGESHHFQAGSYSGYTEWRNALSVAALGVPAKTVWHDPDAYSDRPFYELINFADNEGTIGPEAAADLAQDFEDGRATVRDALGGELLDGYWQRKYDEWDKAFHLATPSGLVRFC